MFDHAPQPAAPKAAPVFFLSGPFGVEREWDGIAGCLGIRPIRGFEDPELCRTALEAAPGGVHLVAYGTACHAALEMLSEGPAQIRSATLVDPDIMAALPNFSVIPVARPGVDLRRRVAGFAATGDLVGAAEAAVDAAMGRGAFARSSARLQARFVRRTRALVGAWRRQKAWPLALCRIGALACPTLVVTGQSAPPEFREVARLLAHAAPQARRLQVAGAGACAHLTDPHVVGPRLRKFVEEADLVWQTSAREWIAA